MPPTRSGSSVYGASRGRVAIKWPDIHFRNAIVDPVAALNGRKKQNRRRVRRGWNGQAVRRNSGSPTAGVRRRRAPLVCCRWSRRCAPRHSRGCCPLPPASATLTAALFIQSPSPKSGDAPQPGETHDLFTAACKFYGADGQPPHLLSGCCRPDSRFATRSTGRAAERRGEII